MVCLGLTLATILAFEEVRLNRFVLFDDDHYVTANLHVKSGLTLESVSWAFTTTHSYNWHPVTWLSHMLDIELFGLEPAGHHLTNLLLHVLNALLLFGLLERTTRRLWPSAFVAALFALHPLHVESVAWISERKDVLSTFFGLLAICAYVDYARRGEIASYVLTALLLALGLMAKPMLVTLPLLFLLLDYWPLERIGRHREGDVYPRRPITRLILEKIPLLAISALSCAATLVAQQRVMAIQEGLPIGLRLANAVVSYALYVWKAVWPSRLAAHYPHPNLPGGTPWTAWEVGGAALLLLGMTAWAIRASRQRYGIVGWLWYLGMLVPVIGLVQVGNQAMADRYTYLPLVGLFVIIAWGAAELISRWSSRQILLRRLATVCAVSMLVACIAATRSQVRYWRNSVSLLERALEVSPTNAQVHYDLGIVLGRRGRIDDAIEHYRDALRVAPGHFRAHNNLGIMLAKQGRFDEAVHHYREALRLEPRFTLARHNLSRALKAKRRRERAR
jgi:hypothetical protein